MISVRFDMTGYKVGVIGSKRIMGSMTNQAVRLGIASGVAFARANHPYRDQTGRLTAAISGKVTSSNDMGTDGELLNMTPYAPCIEYGSKPHRIEPINYWGGKHPTHRSGSRAGKKVKDPTTGVGRGTALRFMIGGRIVFAKYVNHPGNDPMPFMHPAAEHVALEILRRTSSVTFPAVASLWK